jgi:signal transduction histidine kinase/ActR/RegA family two-component response regulator
MSVDPQVIRAEAHVEIGELLELHVSEVLQRWSERAAKEQPTAKRVHHAVLLNQLTEFLKTLGRSLAESEQPNNYQHCLLASFHGEQRWETGWSLTELIRDYQILRLVIVDFLEESLDRPLGYREVLAIGLALDEAIGASVVMYVKGRDEYLRQLEEKRAEDDKKTQEILRQQAEALRQADRRKNEYLAMLAHELRNPLAPVRNAIQILRLKTPADSELLWPREVIERQVRQMSRMIDDLLDISRITLGKVKLEKQPVEVPTVVTRAVEIARPLIDAKKQQLAVALPSEPVWLEVDVDRMVQVLVNLLTNAAKYTDDGGQIWLTVVRQGEEVSFSVRDNGIGIPEDLLTRVFDAYTQEDHLPQRAQGGLGIGLTLARTIVNLHGGKIEALSAGRGRGSEFVVHLTLLKGTPPARPAGNTPQKNPPVAARRILVVDDMPDAAKSLAMLLELLGHDVRTAHDGPSGLQIAQTLLPEIVLLDIGLPGMDGLEVARRLRQEIGLKDALVVALTGYGMEEDRRRSQEAGFNAHLIKPVDLQELQTLLARWEPAAPIEDASPEA